MFSVALTNKYRLLHHDQTIFEYYHGATTASLKWKQFYASSKKLFDTQLWLIGWNTPVIPATFWCSLCQTVKVPHVTFRRGLFRWSTDVQAQGKDSHQKSWEGHVLMLVKCDWNNCNLANRMEKNWKVTKTRGGRCRPRKIRHSGKAGGRPGGEYSETRPRPQPPLLFV